MGTMYCVEHVALVLESTANKVAHPKMIQKYKQRTVKDLFKTPLTLERHEQRAIINYEMVYSESEMLIKNKTTETFKERGNNLEASHNIWTSYCAVRFKRQVLETN